MADLSAIMDSESHHGGRHEPNPERDALLPFVEARLRELSFLAARIRRETVDRQRSTASESSHLSFERTQPSRQQH